MTRLLAFCALLVASVAASADRYALLVAIDAYPIVQGRQLSGSDYDLRLMRKMLDCYGFQTDQLARADATRVAIITKLAKLAEVAKQGDEFVFYFSGRGSIAPPVDQPNAKVQMEPTLVPYDGKETIVDFDLRMKRIEDWAAEITKKGGSVTVIVDASFQSATRDDVGRPYNPVPRTIRRKSTMDGEVREEPYLGPGIYLAATPSGGSAYEYLINASRNIWDGAFTDVFVNEVIGELHKGTAPTYSGVMREVQAYFKDKVRQDYMPGLSPYPFPKTLLAKADVYDLPMFGGVTPSAIPPKQQADIQQMAEEHRKQESKLRIGLSFPAVRGRSSAGGTVSRDADDMEKDRDPQLVDAMTKFVSKNMPFAEVEPPGAPVDLIVSLVKQGSSIEARVAGDEVDQARNLRFAGADVPTLMKAGLADHLERQALSIRLFRFLEDHRPTWDGAADVVADKNGYKPGDPFALTFSCPQPAYLFIFDRDDADGIVQITFPAQGATENRLPGGSKQLSGNIENGSPAGKMLVRALFVDAGGAAAIPAIGSDALAGLLAQLRVVVPGLESGKIRWTSKELSLTVQP